MASPLRVRDLKKGNAKYITLSGGKDRMEEGSSMVLSPVLQEEVPFRDHTITAIKLEDGRYAVVLRWICEVLHLDTPGQIQRIRRTAAIAGELLQVKVQPRPGEKPRRGGGVQTMAVLTLRGFPTWVLGINPGEVAEDAAQPDLAQRIRDMIIAYQVEAVDVLYTYFAQKTRPLLPGPTAAVVPAHPARPQEPEPGADDQALASYYEDLAVWASWKAGQHAQNWRRQMQGQLESLQDQLEGEKAVTDLIPDILARLGPETITPQHQGMVRGYVKRLCELTGKHYQTVYDDIRLAFGPARYQDLLEDDWPKIEAWFKLQIERASRKK
jgi:hypothetical protein